jgi:hypothetical protein
MLGGCTGKVKGGIICYPHGRVLVDKANVTRVTRFRILFATIPIS